MNMNIIGRDGAGSKTETAGTVIVICLPARRGTKTMLDQILVATLGTAHTMTVMRAIGKTTLSAAALAAQAVVNVTANPGPTGNLLAANDYVVIKKPDGTFHIGVVSSIATLAVTLTANVPTGGFAAGAEVWMFGITTDTDPRTGAAHPAYPLTASVTNTYGNASGQGVIGGGYNNEPVLIYINNATNASTILSVTWTHVADGFGPHVPSLTEDDGPDPLEMPLAEDSEREMAA